MIKKYHIPATLFFFICSTTLLFAQKSVYTFPFENDYKLPPLETYINADEISATYQTMGNLYTTEITNVEVEATFFNDSNLLLVTHRGVGQSKKLIGLYSMSTRQVHQKALKNALTDLNTRIMADTQLQKLTLPAAVPEP